MDMCRLVTHMESLSAREYLTLEHQSTWKEHLCVLQAYLTLITHQCPQKQTGILPLQKSECHVSEEIIDTLKTCHCPFKTFFRLLQQGLIGFPTLEFAYRQERQF